MKIVLASQSPRRRALLGQMGLEFTTTSPEIDEDAFQGYRAARDLVQTLLPGKGPLGGRPAAAGHPGHRGGHGGGPGRTILGKAPGTRPRPGPC